MVSWQRAAFPTASEPSWSPPVAQAPAMPADLRAMHIMERRVAQAYDAVLYRATPWNPGPFERYGTPLPLLQAHTGPLAGMMYGLGRLSVGLSPFR